MSLEPNDLSVESPGHIVSGVDDMMLLVGTFLGPESMNGLGLVNKVFFTNVCPVECSVQRLLMDLSSNMAVLR